MPSSAPEYEHFPVSRRRWHALPEFSWPRPLRSRLLSDRRCIRSRHNRHLLRHSEGPRKGDETRRRPKLPLAPTRPLVVPPILARRQGCEWRVRPHSPPAEPWHRSVCCGHESRASTALAILPVQRMEPSGGADRFPRRRLNSPSLKLVRADRPAAESYLPSAPPAHHRATL